LVPDPFTPEELKNALRICGQGKAPCSSGLTVPHLRRANIAEYVLPAFNNAIKNEIVPENGAKVAWYLFAKALIHILES
jgi:hypothetical protein